MVKIFIFSLFYAHVTFSHSGVIAEDALKVSAMYYSGEPIVSSVVKFNEYGENATRMHELELERISIVNEGWCYFEFQTLANTFNTDFQNS